MIKKLFSDPTFIAHGIALLSIVGSGLARLHPVYGGIIAVVTSVFHVAQTFGNGSALPPGWRNPDEPDRSSAVSADGAGFGQPHVDAPAPVLNARGDAEISP